MSDCNVCLYADNGEYCDVFNKSEVVARKQWKCTECDKAILRGEKHQVIRMLFEGEWSVERTCLICAEIRAAFYCDGEIVGNFWSEFYEVIDEVTTGCLQRLTTPEAKAHLMKRVYEHKVGA
jgi:hypothetical protein